MFVGFIYIELVDDSLYIKNKTPFASVQLEKLISI